MLYKLCAYHDPEYEYENYKKIERIFEDFHISLYVSNVSGLYIKQTPRVDYDEKINKFVINLLDINYSQMAFLAEKIEQVPLSDIMVLFDGRVFYGGKLVDLLHDYSLNS